MFIALLFALIFAFAPSSYADARSRGGSQDIIEIDPKTGDNLNFSITDTYIASGRLKTPITISVHNQKKAMVYSQKSMDLSLALPQLEKGTYYITVEIGAYTQTQKLSQ